MQFGFKRQRSTGRVDTSKVYTGGKYFIGPAYDIKVFRADAHFLDLNDIDIFTRDKLEVGADCNFLSNGLILHFKTQSGICRT